MSSDEEEGPALKKQRLYYGSLEEQERERLEREKLAAEELLRAQGSETSESDSSEDEEGEKKKRRKKKKKKEGIFMLITKDRACLTCCRCHSEAEVLVNTSTMFQLALG